MSLERHRNNMLVSHLAGVLLRGLLRLDPVMFLKGCSGLSLRPLPLRPSSFQAQVRTVLLSILLYHEKLLYQPAVQGKG